MPLSEIETSHQAFDLDGEYFTDDLITMARSGNEEVRRILRLIVHYDGARYAVGRRIVESGVELEPQRPLEPAVVQLTFSIGDN